MFQVSINGEPVEGDVTFLTAVIYEQEFSRDIIKDLFGKQDAESGAIEIAGKGDKARIVSIDYTKVDWTNVMRAVWAAIRTADDSVPSFKAWMKSVRNANSWELRSMVVDAAYDCFFRAELAEEGAEAE